jgi:hypothetical protein
VKSHRSFPPYLPLSIFIPSISPILVWALGLATLARVVPYLVGRRGLNEYFLGPTKMETRFVFDLKLALSFNFLTMVCCCFRKTNYSITSSLICYGYIGQMGALTCRLFTRCYHMHTISYLTHLEIF